MKWKELTERLGLEEKHFDMQNLGIPVIDSHLYTVLGKRLFDLYEKYKIEKEDQRDLEALSVLLTAFIADRSQTANRLSRLEKVRRVFARKIQ